jgi:hypothetical protein
LTLFNPINKSFGFALYMKNFLHCFFLFFIYSLPAMAQTQATGKIAGTITDAESGDTLYSVTVSIARTNIGVSADENGFYELKALIPGRYDLVFRSLSYATDTVRGIQVTANKTTVLNKILGQNKQQVKQVDIVKARKTNTEKSVVNEVKKSNNVVSAVSGEQISKSQDRDAAEVIKRIPGVTVLDNRFIMVRGLSDRYNSVLLNDGGTSSSEADKRSFSFDLIPSSLIDKIMIFKTPSAELPGDFAGGMVKIYTRSTMPESRLSINISGGFRPGSTNNLFRENPENTGNLFGFDNGSRDIKVPSLLDMGVEERREATKLFVNDWSILNKKTPVDKRLSATYSNNFKFGIVSIVSITNINYSNTSTFFQIRRKDFDPDKDVLDSQYTNVIRSAALQNFLISIGNHNKIEFRNFYNQMARSQTTIRQSVLKDAPDERSYMLSYENRAMFTSQLNGSHENKKETLKYTWSLGYANSVKNDPDLRRIKYTKQQDQPDSMYSAAIPSGSASPEFGVRFYSKLFEKLYSFNQNMSAKMNILNYHFELNLGSYIEYKTREFNARLLGYTINPGYNALVKRRLPIDQIFSAPNVGDGNGFILDEITEPNYTYTAQNKLAAGYASFILPFKEKFKVIAGARYENNIQALQSFLDQTPISPEVKTGFFLPSLNATYNFNPKNLIRAAYGKTVNRPEFREWSPFKFYDFDFGSDVYGSLFKTILPGSGEVLKTAEIKNMDIRYEYYPNPGEMLHLGVFYKQFTNPIEQYILPGSNRIFTFANAKSAYSKGIELDIRKNLFRLDSLLHTKFFGNLSVVGNVSLIQSAIALNYSFGQQLKRPLQGQSPYIVNFGLYYQNNEQGLQISVLYNIIGPRIYMVGTDDYPSWGEMQRKNLDITLNKRVAKHFSVSLGVQDVLNRPFLILQDSDKNGKFEKNGKDLEIMNYKKGSYYSFGLKYDFK